MIWLRKDTLTWPDFDMSLQQVYDHFFHKPDCAKGFAAEQYFHAPRASVSQRIKQLALKRGFTEVDHKQREWSYRKVCAGGNRRRLYRHELALWQSGGSIESRAYFDLGQTCEFMCSRNTIPALLRHSLLWSNAQRRIMLAPEALEVMTVGPLYQQKHYTEADDSRSVPSGLVDLHERPEMFDALINANGETPPPFSDAEMRSMAGNSICLEVFGAVALVTFSHMQFNPERGSDLLHLAKQPKPSLQSELPDHAQRAQPARDWPSVFDCLPNSPAQKGNKIHKNCEQSMQRKQVRSDA